MKLSTRFFTQALICLFICFIPSTVIYGQNNDFQHKKDSLLKVIASTQGEEKLKAYEILVTRLQFPDEEIDLILQYANEFVREARKQQNKEYESLAYRMELKTLNNFSRHDEFERKANEYLPFFKKNGFHKNYYESYVALLQVLGKKWDAKRKIEGVKQMYAEAKQENCLYGIAQATRLMAQIYSSEERYEDSEKYFRETIKNALKLIEEEPNLIVNHYLISEGYYGLASTLINQEKIDECFSLMSVWKKRTITFEETFGYPDPDLTYYYRVCAHVYASKKEYDKVELYCDSLEPLLVHGELSYIWNLKAFICEERGEYDSAIDWIDKNIAYSTNFKEWNYTVHLLKDKARILNKMGRLEAYSVFEAAFQRNDSLRLLENNAQLDEIRTQYEVDKYIVEKERLRNNLLFAIGGCVLLAILLGGWIYYSRKITKKNRILALQIKELTAQQEDQINEMLTKTTFSPYSPNEATSVSETIDSDLCVESRIDKMCIAIRDFLFKDKIYRDPSITQEHIIERLATNRRAFNEAMESCFGMQFKDYVNFLRLKDAVLLLEQSDLSIETISDKVGFGTVRSFRRQFSDKYGMAPKNYRDTMVTTTSPS
ncbi:MAG: helix-turn-helix domain-containing protein [Dysgonamonadaceae bacterium]|jgi:AraC-like DNA-binding protein|nr:helix-turn-helix domain-containing protein [Dysgonamonadaceae bacterium]